MRLLWPKTILLLLITNSILVSAETSKKFVDSKMNIHHIVMIRNALINFNISIDKNTEKITNQNVFLDINFFTRAYAANDKCFFGGWPSRMIGKVCKAPWTHGDKSWGSSIDCGGVSCSTKINTSYNSCGGATKFRCSPLLFGVDENGNGKCIDTGGNYYGLTQKCVDDEEIKSNTPQSAKFLNDNPEILNQLVSESEEFCKQNEDLSNPNYDHNKTCSALRERLEYIKNTVQEDESLERDVATSQSEVTNKVAGFLNKCQEKYNKDNEAWWDLESRRKSLNYMANSALCQNEVSTIDDQEFAELYKNIQKVDQNVLPNKMLNDTLDMGFELSLKNYLVTRHQFDDTAKYETNGDLDAKRIYGNLLHRYPSLKGNDRYLDIVKKSVDDINNAFANNSVKKIDKNKMKESLNEFGNEFRNICSEINNDFLARSSSSNKGAGDYIDRSGDWNPMDTDSEEAYYQQAQIKLNNKYADFQKSDVNNQYGRLLSTDYFRKNIFPFNANLAKKCARGDVVGESFIKINDRDIERGIYSYKSMMMEDFESLNELDKESSSGDEDDIEDSLEELIKYKPYLLGEFLKRQSSNEDQMSYAKYLCKQSLDLYNSDELFRAGEITIGAVGLVAAGFLTVTGIGAPAGGATAVASASLITGAAIAKATTVAVISSELLIAGNKYNDGVDQQRNASVSLMTASADVETYSIASAEAENTKNGAVTDGALVIVPAAAPSFIKPAKRIIQKFSKPKVSPGTNLVVTQTDDIGRVSNARQRADSDVIYAGNQYSDDVIILGDRSTQSADEIIETTETGIDLSRNSSISTNVNSPGTGMSNIGGLTERSTASAARVSTAVKPRVYTAIENQILKSAKLKELPLDVLPNYYQKGVINSLSDLELQNILKRITGSSTDLTKRDLKALKNRLHPDKAKTNGIPESGLVSLKEQQQVIQAIYDRLF